MRKFLPFDNVLVFGITDRFYGQDVCICVESNLEKNIVEKKLLKFIFENLSKIYFPKKIIVLKKLPRLPSEKININEIRRISNNYEDLY